MREMADWLRLTFPSIPPAMGWDGDPCWVSFMMTRDAEHNPPFYWLGRALDVVEAAGATDLFGERLRSAHGAEHCQGTDDRDERVQDVLSEACAFAWATEHLGPVDVDPASASATEEVGPILLHVPSANAWVAPRRLRGVPTMERLMYQVAAVAETAAKALPEATSDHGPGGRIVYADIWHERMYAQNVGYRIDLTEPLQGAVRHFAAEHRLGYVLTRPFEWGRPIEAWY